MHAAAVIYCVCFCQCVYAEMAEIGVEQEEVCRRASR